MNLNSIIKCPKCGYEKDETMPVDSCQFFYECTNCKKVLKPKKGDCCVFCSYGSVKCPPMQEGGVLSISLSVCKSINGVVAHLIDVLYYKAKFYKFVLVKNKHYASKISRKSFF